MALHHYAVEDPLAQRVRIEIPVGGPLPRLDAEDRVVVFVRKNQQVRFVGSTSVASRKQIAKSRLAQVEFHPCSYFKKPLDLRVVGGTMLKVERVLTPEWHFRRDIVALLEWDFETIKKRRVDHSRTFFRYVFAALPIGLKGEFLSAYRHTHGLGIGGVVDTYRELAPALLSFLWLRLGTTFDLMEQVRSLYNKIDMPDLPKLDDLVLGTDVQGDCDMPLGRIIAKILSFRSDSPLFSPNLEEPMLEVWSDILQSKEGAFGQWNENVQ